MKIASIQEKKNWEDFLSDCDEKTFLTSWNWGEFQKAMGGKIWRLGIYEISNLKSQISNLTGVALVIKVSAKRGTFLLVPHGPNVKTESPAVRKEVLNALLGELKKIAAEEKASFIRVSPIWARNQANADAFKQLGFRSASSHAHPVASWRLDISRPENELLAHMRKTTRYLIRQAQKNNEIKITQGTAPADVEAFNALNIDVAKRQRFVPFSLDYLKKEFSSFVGDSQVSIFFGKMGEDIAASSFVLFWSGGGFYHHAALSLTYHKTPISYLMQWEAIREAKRRGYLFYDFWGFVDPKTHPNHPWAGPTLFKMGFGGEARNYVMTQDFIISKKYWIIYAFETLRKIKRGL